MKKLTVIVSAGLLLLLLLPSAAWAVDSSRSYDFSLTVNGGASASVDVGDTVTVQLTLSRTDEAASGIYRMYAMQDELVYDTDYLTLVPDSQTVADGFVFNTRDFSQSSRQKAVFSYLSLKVSGNELPDQLVVGSFQLRAVKEGLLTVSSTNYKMVTSSGNDVFAAAANDVTINVNAQPQYPTIRCGEGGRAQLSSDGSRLTILPDSGYRIYAVLLNGVSQGGAAELHDLKTGDLVAVVFAPASATAVTFRDYGGAPAGYRLVRLAVQAPAGFAYQYGSQPLYWSEDANASVCLVANEVSAESFTAALSLTESAATPLSSGGDLNGDGRVMIDDAQLAYDLYTQYAGYYRNAAALTERSRLEADVNGDGVVDTLDAMAIFAAVMNL